MLFSGISHMHSCGVVHRDLKPSNLLLQSSTRQELQLVVADFGWSRGVPIHDTDPAAGLAASQADELPSATPGACAWPYRAPEIFMCLPYGMPADVWAGGVIMWQLFTARTQFWSRHHNGLSICALMCGPITEATWPGCSNNPAWKCQPDMPQQLPWPSGRRPSVQAMVHSALAQLPHKRLRAADICERAKRMRRPHRIYVKRTVLTPYLMSRTQARGLAAGTSVAHCAPVKDPTLHIYYILHIVSCI